MHTHEPHGVSHAAGERSHREVVLLASESTADVSRLMSQLAVRGRRVEVVKDEVAAVRRTLGHSVELLILVQPTSDAARHQLAEAMTLHRPDLTLVNWDAASQQLTPIGLSPSSAEPLSAIEDDPIDDLLTNANPPASPDSPDYPIWADDDYAEPLTTAELDALLGHAEPTGP